MSEYGDDARDGESQDAAEEEASNTASANNSIIGKMKTSVSSILPNSISRWFSPSSTPNNNSDSANGNHRTPGTTTKRTFAEHAQVFTPLTGANRNENAPRRIDIENDEDEEDDDDGGDGAARSNCNDDVRLGIAPRPRPSLNSTMVEEHQPPSKRSRFTLDGSLLTSRPPIASTPSITVPRYAGIGNNNYNFNLYAGLDKKQVGYNFFATPEQQASYEQQSNAPDIIDLVPIPMSNSASNSTTATNRDQNSHSDIRSRRTLNIPVATNTTSITHASSNLVRQSLSSVKSDVQRDSVELNRNEVYTRQPPTEEVTTNPIAAIEENTRVQESKYNGRFRPQLFNGADGLEEDLRNSDSEAESDTLADLPLSPTNRNITSQPITGLFNTSAANSRTGSRTSSFGNGLNFYTHLEGRKSLFAGANPNIRHNAFKSSTQSLNSLSKRRFNASIYGSTSALSDSRIFNTSSPFYNGKTTYGGAAAYNKYAAKTSAAARLTPTVMRPTSSLSTLSSSNNSLAAGTSNFKRDQSTAISDTSRSIMQLLDNIATPLSEVKRMGNSLRQQPTTSAAAAAQTQKLKRLNDSDLQASRAMRLQQVNTPYARRPMVMLHAKNKANDTQMPPVRELMVPSMTQLLQMKKMQSLTERSRQICQQKSADQTYASATTVAGSGILKPTTTKPTIAPDKPEPLLSTAPPSTSIGLEGHSGGSQNENVVSTPAAQQQKHVNKIKNKINIQRAPKINETDAPFAVDLKNVKFPAMNQMPKIDITLPLAKSDNGGSKIVADVVLIDAVDTTKSKQKDAANGFKFSAPTNLYDLPNSLDKVKPAAINFEFSKPETLPVAASSMNSTKQPTSVFPTNFAKPSKSIEVTTTSTGFKSGSVLDALKRQQESPKSIASFFGPTTAASTSTTTTTTSLPIVQPLSSFGNQFKKAANEWDCDVCMVRNKESAKKCVSCETLRKLPSGKKQDTAEVSPLNIAGTTLTTTTTASSTSPGFGNQFKKLAGEWECNSCMVRNKSEASKCISCETPKKTAAGAAPAQSFGAAPFVTSSFGDAFKPKANSWECSTCLVSNKAEHTKCIACETPKPGSSSSSTSLASSLSSATNVAPLIGADSGFKSIAAAQHASKWECDACMTRNDAARSKCACCEQAKPGSNVVNESVPKFSFGAPPATKFNFGFAAAGGESNATQTTSAKSSQKTEENTFSNKTPFAFGTATTQATPAGAGSGSFSFGFPAAKPTATDSKKNATDGAEKENKFTFGFGGPTAGSTPPSKVATSATSTAPSVTFMLPPATTSTSSATTQQSTPAPPKTSPFTFGKPASIEPSSSSSAKPSGGLSFGFAPQKPADGDEKKLPPTNTSSSSLPSSITSVGFNFPATTTVAASISAVVSSTTTPAAAAVVKPMFSFGAPSVPNTSTTAVSSTTLSTTAKTTAAIVSAFAPSSTTTAAASSGFNFGVTQHANVTETTTTPAKSLFGGITATPNSTMASSGANTFAAFGSGSSSFNINKTESESTAPISSTTMSTPFGGFGFGQTAATSQPPSTVAAGSGNLFGTFAAKPQGESKPTAVFGAAANQVASEPATSSTWPKNTFTFGSPSSSTTIVATTTSAPAGAAPTPPKLVFANLGAATAGTQAQSVGSTTGNVNPTPLMFGNVTASSSLPVFGSNAAGNAAPVFGASSTSTVLGGTTSNIFGGNNQNQSSTTSSLSFGAAPAGNTLPAFGSSAAASSTTTFGSFGAPSAASSKPTGAEAATPFSFGAQNQISSGGFNFASVAAKPAFNFNFTGGTTETTQNSSRPFQFGAPPTAAAPAVAAAAPPTFGSSGVFNFSGASATESTSNAPFQFNAGPTPASSNIFAPAPQPPTIGGAQAARRKIRAPIRRSTPR